MKKLCSIGGKAAVFLLTFSLICLGFYRWKLEPVLCRLAREHTAAAASARIETAIEEGIQTGNLPYSRMILFEKDSAGKITALKTDMQQVNLLKTGILREINESVLKLGPSELGIPLGDLILPEFFGGKGPVFPAKVQTLQYSRGHFISSFSQAGINQTLHRLLMEVQLEGTLLVLGNIQNFSAANTVLVAETVIVGEVPHSYS